MKIVINALSARQGGGQTYLRNLFDHLPRQGPNGDLIRVFLLAPESLRALEKPGHIEFLSGRWTVASPLTRAVWERFGLPRLLRTLGADVLFTPGGTSLARPPAPCRLVTMFRNMIPFDLAQRRRYPLGYQRLRNWLLERIMLKSMINADLVIFISSFARGVVEARAAGQIKRAVVISHGISDHFRLGIERLPRPGWTPPSGYFLYVSTLDYYKNQLEVVRGFLQAKARAGFAQKLLLVGPGNPEYIALVQKEIASQDAQDQVLLVGSVCYEDLPALYQNATINIFASESENCPNILLEALASGRPILCSDRPPMPEFAGDAVFYFDPRSSEALATRLVELLGRPEIQNELAARSLSWSRRYSWSEAARRTWDAILAAGTHA